MGHKNSIRYDHGTGYHIIDFTGPGPVRNNLLNATNALIKGMKVKFKKIKKVILQCKKI